MQKRRRDISRKDVKKYDILLRISFVGMQSGNAVCEPSILKVYKDAGRKSAMIIMIINDHNDHKV